MPQTAHEQQPQAPVMELLQHKVPLALLLDVTAPEGPASREILETEGAPETSWWLPAGHVTED